MRDFKVGDKVYIADDILYRTGVLKAIINTAYDGDEYVITVAEGYDIVTYFNNIKHFDGGTLNDLINKREMLKEELTDLKEIALKKEEEWMAQNKIIREYVSDMK